MMAAVMAPPLFRNKPKIPIQRKNKSENEPTQPPTGPLTTIGHKTVLELLIATHQMGILTFLRFKSNRGLAFLTFKSNRIADRGKKRNLATKPEA
ncbi:unnamed protein product [Lactuca virosa]|uniref:RRM domain-containing protein n=1 Tax=Lactuca virosa TaxID=75947 RepID=A0AAU9PG25_9ASTR|nr:unnamed protein product [Lactuca virosa]